tara:strand:- start:2518 stop:3186 length:669 start_codon:yes stop_codon:yes gene_type:complete
VKNLKLVFLVIFLLFSYEKSTLADDSHNSISIINELYDFSTIKNNKNLQLEWELKGLKLSQYSNNITHIKKPRLLIHDESTLTSINSETAIDPSGKMEEIYLKNNVFISSNKTIDNATTKMYTSYAIVYVLKNIIETDRDVTIITSDSKTTGKGFSANIETGVITILSDVKRVIRENDKIRTIEGNQMIYNTNSGKWLVKNKPAKIMKDRITKKVITTFDIK